MHPDVVPPCINCRRRVPASELEGMYCSTWYFCQACRDDDDVVRRWAGLFYEAGK